MSLDKFKEIVTEFDKSNMCELVFEDKDMKLVLRKDKDEASSTEKPDIDDNWILSPLVGIFYDAEPKIKVGQRVLKGQLLCMVSAMKIMNKISSPKDGIIEEITFQNGEDVEFGAPLIRISNL